MQAKTPSAALYVRAGKTYISVEVFFDKRQDDFLSVICWTKCMWSTCVIRVYYSEYYLCAFSFYSHGKIC